MAPGLQAAARSEARPLPLPRDSIKDIVRRLFRRRFAWVVAIALGLVLLACGVFVLYGITRIGSPYGPHPPTTPAVRVLPYSVTPARRKELVEAFGQLRVGMDAATVYQLMGTPDDVWGPRRSLTQQQKWTYYVSIRTPGGTDPTDARVVVWLWEGKTLWGFNARNMPELDPKSFEPK